MDPLKPGIKVSDLANWIEANKDRIIKICMGIAPAMLEVLKKLPDAKIPKTEVHKIVSGLEKLLEIKEIKPA